MYNLTENQKDVLKTLVNEIRTKKRSEEFLAFRTEQGMALSFNSLADRVDFPGLTRGALEALHRAGLLHLRVVNEAHALLACTIAGEAFGAVDTNFTPEAPTWSADANQVIIQGSVYGAVQVASPHAQQHVSLTQTSQVGESIEKLRDLLKEAAMPQLDKEEAALALDRVADLAGREKSPDVLAKIKEKLDSVTSICGNVVGLAATAGPHLAALWEAVSKSL